jgi:DNA-binding response OmpR family regulator
MNDELYRILLIEDNAGDARLIRELLTEDKTISFEIEWVERLSEGLKRLEQNNISVVLLDLSLPDSNGFETFSKVHRVAPQIPIVVLTGLNDSNLGLQMVESGAQDYLVKGSYDRNIFLRSIRYAIERKNIELKYQLAIDELQSAIDNIKTLHGLLPICANCKKIRDDKGYWQQVEGYIMKHSDAKFSHGICPECKTKLYPDFKNQTT